MEGEVGHELRVGFVKVAKIPDSQRSVVGACGDHAVGESVPRQNVDVRVVRLDAQRRFCALSRVPHAHRLIGRARYEHISLGRGPLDVLHARIVPGVRRRADVPLTLHHVPRVNRPGAITTREPSLAHRGPIKGVAFVFMTREHLRRRHSRRWIDLALGIVRRRHHLFQLRAQIPNHHVPRIAPTRARARSLRHRSHSIHASMMHHARHRQRRRV